MARNTAPEPPAILSRENRRDLVMVALFVGLTGILYTLSRWDPVHQAVVQPITRGIASASGLLLSLVYSGIARSGSIVSAGMFSIDIMDGCNAVFVTIVFLSGVAAFPGTWKGKALGLLAGPLLIQAGNLLRIVVLFCIGKEFPAFFDKAHIFIAQVLVIAFTLVLFLLWAGRFASYGQPETAGRRS